jgi:recombination protein RecA
MAKKKEEVKEETGDKAVNIDRVLRNLRDSFNKDRGDGDKIAWNLATDDDNPTDTKEFISTGSTLLDYVISNRRDGGVPVGKITEITGEEASGKSLLCGHIAANTQKMGGVVVYIDTENAYSPDFMRRLGVDNSKVLYLQPGTIEKCFEAVEKTITTLREKAPDRLLTIIWDSVAGTPPQAEIEGSYDANSRIGLMAKAMSIGMRKLTDTFGKERVAMVFTNQLKQKLGVMYGDPWTTPGGKALPYHASVRIRLTGSTKLKDPKTDQIFGIQTTGACKKTRLGPPHRTCRFQIHFASGVDDMGSWREFLHDRKVIEKANGFMILRDVPAEDVTDPKTGEILPAPAGTLVPELKFREGKWHELLAERPRLRAWVEDKVQELMTVVYEKSNPAEIEDVQQEEFEGEVED